ncbi:ATP-binding protein [Fervidicella metallireducens AeB]|uniref:ATP-binding protein n=1 Tax=Fervidicella metallireducens AeB TaxID=1403537 RepID=A0A017RTH6_9CLOT|nr:IS21-like element helper ATPase IstB [Fervidicella metallireducens]EYE87200.1 ATP-binding protein [Fervidicella metallireducens AeB]
MSHNIKVLESMLRTLKMYHTAENIGDIIEKALENSLTCEKFLEEALREEIKGRETRKLEKRLKQAFFPEYKTLSEFNLAEQKSLSQRQLNQLKELVWLEQGYNIVFLGPPGVGKTHLSIGIGIEAINNGYKVRFSTIADLIHLLKTQEISSSSRNKVKKIIDCDLFIIDDLMFMAMEKQEANLFFQLINKLYGQTSIIITSNKGPEEWGELLGDAAITTAILDRIVHKCEVVNFFNDDSYRIKHRQSIFGNSQ